MEPHIMMLFISTMIILVIESIFVILTACSRTEFNHLKTRLEDYQEKIESNRLRVSEVENLALSQGTDDSIGEVFTENIYNSLGTGEIIFVPSWVKFETIQDEVDGWIKVLGEWHKRKNVVLYDEIRKKHDPVEKEKRKIERRMNKDK